MSNKLVCGYGGFLGTAIARALNDTFTHKRNDGDLTTPEAWQKLLWATQPEIVFMCAGVTGGSGLDPMVFGHDNLLMHAQMFRECAAAGVKRIVMFSSVTGYPDSPESMREDQYFEGEPHPAYYVPGWTRRHIERMAEMYADKIETVRLRVTNAYGPGDNYDPQTSHVIAATVRKVAERQDPIHVWGDGSNVRDAVYIDDVVNATLMAESWPAGAYNIACGESMSVLEIAEHLTNCAGYDPGYLFDASKPSMLKTRLLNTEKAQRMGWKPSIGMKDGLKKTLEWYARR